MPDLKAQTVILDCTRDVTFIPGAAAVQLQVVRQTVVAVGSILILSGCSDDVSSDQGQGAVDKGVDSVKADLAQVDAQRMDSSTLDAARLDKLDGTKPDAAKQDAAKPDAAKSDAAQPDAAKSDADQPDAAKSDAAKQDAAKQDAAKLDAAQPDAAKPDAAKPDAAQPDAAKLDIVQPDAPPKDQSLPTDSTISGCQNLILRCSGSPVWKQYVTPFTLSQCLKEMTCVYNLYQGTCLSQFQALVSCVATIPSSAACNTSCLGYLTYLTTNCVCPKACGVPCP